jgi:hypothetical protein
VGHYYLVSFVSVYNPSLSFLISLCFSIIPPHLISPPTLPPYHPTPPPLPPSHHNKALSLFPLNSSTTVLAALVPSSIAPSIKLLHPTAQSEFAKNTFPCLARKTSRYSVMNSLPGKNHAPFAYGSSDQLWNTCWMVC